MCGVVVIHACPASYSSFFFNDPASSEIYTLSLHDALPIFDGHDFPLGLRKDEARGEAITECDSPQPILDYRTKHDIAGDEDRKSTRLNSSHVEISYAVFCLKKKKK